MSEKRVGVAVVTQGYAVSLVDRAISPETNAVAALRAMTFYLLTIANFTLINTQT